MAAAKKAAKKAKIEAKSAERPGINVYTFVRGLGYVVVEEE